MKNIAIKNDNAQGKTSYIIILYLLFYKNLYFLAMYSSKVILLLWM